MKQMSTSEFIGFTMCTLGIIWVLICTIILLIIGTPKDNFYMYKSFVWIGLLIFINGFAIVFLPSK